MLSLESFFIAQNHVKEIQTNWFWVIQYSFSINFTTCQTEIKSCGNIFEMEQKTVCWTKEFFMHKLSARLMQISVLNINKANGTWALKYRPTFSCWNDGTDGKGFDIPGYGLLDFQIIMWLLSIIENGISSHLNHSSLVLSQRDFIRVWTRSKGTRHLFHTSFSPNFKTKRELIQNFNDFKVRVAETLSTRWKTQQIVPRVQMSLLYFKNKRGKEWERASEQAT